MKKLISALMALTMLITLTPTHSYCTETDDPELYALADSFGANTDFLPILNYKHDENNPLTMEMYNEYLYKCSLLEAAYYPMDVFTSTVSLGSCLGISLLEILSHNGVISPDDILEGAKTLSEISYNKDIDKIITSYQASQGFTVFNNYEKYLVYAQSYEEQIDKLIETAENCINENKYFLIVIRGKKLSHSVCGIGISNGEWVWNEKKYDKCILTLDSNVQDTKGNAVGFSNKSCIYINSKTKESYIPAYELNMEQDPAYSVIDDEMLLNYKGMINPSDSVSDEVSNINHFSYSVSENTKVYSVSNGEIVPIKKPFFVDVLGPAALIKCDSVHIEMSDEYEEYPDFRYVNTDRWIDVQLESDYNLDYGEYNGTIDISDNLIKIKNTGEKPYTSYTQIRMNDGTYNFSPYFRWSINGNISDDLTIEILENGILLKSNSRIDMLVEPARYVLDDNGKLQYTSGGIVTDFVSSEQRHRYINSTNNVLVTIDDKDKIVCYIDDNNDEIYDVEVVKGDANYDGIINASDASAVLAHYAKLSTSSKRIPTDIFTMDYNQDDIVDASDASAVLAHYAKLSTSSKRIPTDIFTMDYNQDDIVDASDASLILSYYSGVQTSNK